MGYELRDYLEIDEVAAIRQWRRICDRRMPAAGRKQEDFCPVEVLLCFALFRVVEPGRFGGANKHLLPSAVTQLAATLRRPPMSLIYKMQNLAAVLDHGAKLEPEVFRRLSTDPILFIGLYRIIVQAARAEGIGEASVPDFLELAGGLALVGQDEIGSLELGIAVAEYADSDAGKYWRKQFGDRETEQVVEARVRLGQDRFARQVLADYEHQCAFCGMQPTGLDASGMLIASHVKPWAKCDNSRERLDPGNGIAACPIHDKAFDSGLLTVNGGCRIHLAANLELRIPMDKALGYFFGADILPERLRVPPGRSGPGRRYLDYHGEHVFMGAR